MDIEDDEVPDDVPAQLWFSSAETALAFAAELPHTRRRMPWRYRWPEEVRDEVLIRLLKLNAERAAEERRTGVAAAAVGRKKAKKKARRSRKKKRRKAAPNEGALFDTGDQGGNND